MTLAQLEKQLQAEQQLQEQQLQEFERYLDGLRPMRRTPGCKRTCGSGASDFEMISATSKLALPMTCRFDRPGNPPARTQVEVRKCNDGRLLVFVEARRQSNGLL